MSGKKTTTSSSTATMTPNAPEWVQQGVQGVSNQATNLMGQDPTSFFAPAQGLNQQQFGLAGQLGQQGASNLGQAASMAASAGQATPVSHATAQTAAGGIGAYLNPFSDYVAGNTLNELGRARDMAQQGNGRDAILAGQYGGSRQGVVDANLNRDFFGQVGNTMGNLYSSGFNTALGASGDDANRAQQTSMFNAGADNTSALAGQQAQLQGAGLLGQLGQYGTNYLDSAGATQQGLAQQQSGAPLTVLSQLGQIQGSLPYKLFTGSTTQTNGTNTTPGGGLLGTLGDIAKIGASVAPMFSDGRMKRDIETVGHDAKGRRWVDYNYLWDAADEPKRRGVIAQEVRATDPDAVMLHPSGFLMVDYSKLED